MFTEALDAGKEVRTVLRHQQSFDRVWHEGLIYKLKAWAPRGYGDLGRMAIYFQGSRDHWLLF